VDSTTIRDYITRRVRIAFGVGFAAWLIAAFSTAAHSGGAVPSAFFVAGVLMAAAVVHVTWFVRCPWCSAYLGQTVATPIAFPWGRRQMKFCPYCAVSLDEPVSRGPIKGG